MKAHQGKNKKLQEQLSPNPSPPVISMAGANKLKTGRNHNTSSKPKAFKNKYDSWF
jgi:hypothetical protein